VDEVRRAAVITRYFGRVWDDARAAAFARKLGVERMLAAWDGEEVVGGAGAFPFELSVPGGRSVRAGGVTIVGVLPTHRRRGVLTALMRAQLDDLHARGEPVAYLWASEGTIYGRFGYGVASLQLELDVPRERTAYALPLGEYGRVRLVGREEALTAFPELYEQQFGQRPGMFARTPDWWAERTLPAEPPGPPRQHVLLEVEDRPEAYAVYQVHQSWEHGSSTGHVEVQEAVAAGPRALAAIWRYLLDLDWTSRIRAGMLPVDHPLVLLLAEPRRAGLHVGDALWVRLVDVGEALSARGYASDEELVLDVRDAFCPWNEGRWRLAGGRAERTDGAPALRLDVTALAGAYLGGCTFRQLADALRVEELEPGAVERADRVFRVGRAPWCPEIF
jgi:predicted acetyltransferase